MFCWFPLTIGFIHRSYLFTVFSSLIHVCVAGLEFAHSSDAHTMPASCGFRLFFLPFSCRQLMIWNRELESLCLLQIRCCLFKKIWSFPGLSFPSLASGHVADGVTLVVLLKPPRLGWASLWVVCARDNRTHLAPWAVTGSHSFDLHAHDHQ